MEELNLKEYLLYIKKRLIIIVLIILTFFIIGCIYSKNNYKAIYKSEVIMSIFSTGGLDETSTNRIGVDTNMINTYSKLITSRNILESVIEDLNLQISYDDLASKVNVTTEENNAIIKISLNWTDEKESVEIINKIANNFASNIDTLIKNNYIRISVLDEAVNAKKVTISSEIKYISIFVVLGTIISFGLFTIKYYFDDNIKSLEGLKKISNNKVIGIIHNSKNYDNFEDYKLLRNNMVCSTNPKSILITTPILNDDKNKFCLNLAKSYSQIESTILLNLDKTNIINYQDETCIKSLKQYNKNIIKEVEENLYFLDLSEFEDNKLLDLLDKIFLDFEQIIINGSSITNSADTLMISKQVDGTIILSKINYVSEEQLKDCETMLNNINSNLIGIVATNVNAKR